MALNVQTLQDGLKDLFDSAPATKALAAAGMASAYAEYAAGGQFGTSSPEFTTQETALAATILGTGLVGTIAGFGTAWSSGLATFWAAVPVVGAQAGVTSPPVYPTLSAELTAVLATYPETTESSASQIAAILHAATQTVTATVAPPPGTVLPIV